MALLEPLVQAASRCREEIAAFDSYLQVSPANSNATDFHLQCKSRLWDPLRVTSLNNSHLEQSVGARLGVPIVCAGGDAAWEWDTACEYNCGCSAREQPRLSFLIPTTRSAPRDQF